jgi:hypothetical protein
MASTPSDGEVAVFTDTNMDTHIAMGISPDITVADFKSNFLSIIFFLASLCLLLTSSLDFQQSLFLLAFICFICIIVSIMELIVCFDVSLDVLFWVFFTFGF